MSAITIAGLTSAGAKANQDINPDSMKYTSRLIVARALDRGWSVAHFEECPPLLFIEIPDKQVIRVFSASPPTMSYPATKNSRNKYMTTRLLDSIGLPAPEELVVTEINDLRASKFMEKAGKIVVKPMDLSHGNGVLTNITEQAVLNKAIKEAVELATSSKALVQKQYGGYDVRVLCIDYKYANAITRMPARVIGDGVLNVQELIEKENKTPARGENYRTRLNVIDIKRARQYLGESGIKRVPAPDEEVFVVGISNVGAGGERQNIANDVPEWMKNMAIEASMALELPVCGVDFLVSERPTKQATVESLQPVILEVNECPMMTMYEDLHSKEQYVVIDMYLDYLERIAV